MCKTQIKYILLVIVCLVVVSLVWQRPRQVTERVISRTDTVTIVKRDTITKYIPKYITKKVVDTIWIKDTVYVLREQKRYFEQGIYEVWISGYQPQLDSIKVFPKVEYRTITDTRIHYVKDNKWRLYVGGGFKAFLGQVSPSVATTIATPKNTLISADLGYYKGLYYGITIQKEIKW